MNVLYLSYDGALDPLGRSQVLPYLEGLSACGHQFDLITFEKPHRLREENDRRNIAQRLRASGIRWHPLRYHKRFSALATSYDLARGFALGAALTQLRHIDLVHARSYPSALIAWRLSRAFGVPFLFDMRGLYAEERTEGGMWPVNGTLYRMTKRLERNFLRDAHGVVTLTRASVPIVTQWVADAGGRASPVVIPTCVDTKRFSPKDRVTKFELAYLGSIGTWYMLEEMLQFGSCVLSTYPDATLRFVTNEAVALVRGRAQELGIPLDRLSVTSVSHEAVPAALSESAATFHFIRPTFSKTASAATKFAESLALGLPVVVNPGVGDAADIVRARNVGVVVDAFTRPAYRAAAEALRELLTDPGVRDRCRRAAMDIFSLDSGVEKYAALYESLMRPSRSQFASSSGTRTVSGASEKELGAFMSRIGK